MLTVNEHVQNYFLITFQFGKGYELVKRTNNTVEAISKVLMNINQDKQAIRL